MLNVLAEWCESWKMKINNEKTQIIHFQAKKSKITEFSFNLGSPDSNIAIVNKRYSKDPGSSPGGDACFSH